jgi:hypothetical protein
MDMKTALEPGELRYQPDIEKSYSEASRERMKALKAKLEKAKGDGQIRTLPREAASP